MKDLNWLRWIKNGQTHFCPGCQYGIIRNLLAYSLEKAGFEPEQVAAISGIGCAGWITDRYLNVDTMHTTHGRPVAFATGVKQARPELKVIVVSGDGDLADIGLNHLKHAGYRDEDLSVFLVNNHCYGMTGGQACITTPHGIITPTTPLGKSGQPVDLIKEMLITNCSLASRYPAIPLGKSPYKTIDAIVRSLKHQGLSFFEFVSPCVTHFCRKNGLPDVKAIKKYLATLSIEGKDVADSAEPKLKEKKNKLPYGTFESLAQYFQLITEDR